MVSLEMMSENEVASWVTTLWSSYVEQLLAAGFTADEAQRNVERNAGDLFIDGVPKSEQRIFHVLDNGVRCGFLWLGRREEMDSGEWYVYDIDIAEGSRARGLGRATMEAAEEYVLRHGGTRLALNVFGHNVVARGLYESLGY